MFPLALIALAVAAPIPAEGVDLRWKLKPGDTFYATTRNVMKQTVTAGGNTQAQNQNQTTYHQYKVKEAGPNQLVLEQTVIRSAVDGNLPGAADAADRLKGAVLTYTLDDKYKVTKLDGYDDFLDRASGDNAAAKKMLAAIMTEKTLKTGVEDLLGFSPGQNVRPGDTWKRKTEVSLGPIGDIIMNMTYRYEGPAGEDQKVTAKADMKYNPPPPGAVGLPIAIKDADMKVEDFESEFRFDQKLGRLRTSTIRMEMTGNFTFTNNGTDIKVHVDQEMTVTSTLSSTVPEGANE